MSYKVPVSVVAPYVVRYVRQHTLPPDVYVKDAEEFFSPVRELAFRSGLSRDLIQRINAGNYHCDNVAWTTADRLLCAVGAPMAWHTDPALRPHYWEGRP